VFGSFITWLQEKRSPVFVIATANDVSQLPPELLRKGRFDEIFFCDLPDREERAKILDIHIRKKNRDPGAFDLDKLVDATIDYSGAEIEQAVVAALYDAFDTGGDLTSDGLLRALQEIVPLAITMRERIDGMREWARTRARRASGKSKSHGAKSGNSWIERHGGKAPAAEAAEPERELEL
jgi:SpoVK/Ycf46/Vps4 family AAA+-type ATPase